MAQTQRHTASARKPVYRTNGAAAYDIHRYEAFATGNAARQLEQPKPQRHVHHRPKPKAKLMIAPVSVMGLLIVACMLVFVISGYVRLFEETTAVSELQDQLNETQEYQERLRATYNDMVDLDKIQERANELGMSVPNSKQTIYLALEGCDRAVISGGTQESVTATAWHAIRSSIHTLVEYFS